MPFIRRAVARLGSGLNDPRSFLPELDQGARAARQDGQRRGMPTQRREAVFLLMQWLVEHMDFITLNCGFAVNTDDGISIQPVDLEYIATEVGLPLQRAERAFRDLTRFGPLKVTYRVKVHANGDMSNQICRARASYKRVLLWLFSALGMQDEFDTVRAYLLEKRIATNNQLRRKASMKREALAEERRSAELAFRTQRYAESDLPAPDAGREAHLKAIRDILANTGPPNKRKTTSK